ncbi:hypothetical protein AB205_0157960, partial [Aquarana catesbeiana]
TPREENAYAELNIQHKNEPIFKGWVTQCLVVILFILFFIVAIFICVLFILYSNMMDKITKLDSAFNDIKNKGSNVKYPFTDEVIAYYSSDSQRIMELLGKVAEEVQKMKNSSNPLCSEGWRHYGLSCYYFSSDTIPWIASKKACEDKNAHLVVINGEGEKV